MSLKLSSQLAEVTVVPEKGADMLSFVDRRSGVDVLFKTPWGMRTPGPWARRGTSQERWMEAYAGGWQLLLPNGGDECVERGATWGFHGEAALVPWEVVSATKAAAVLETTLFLSPCVSVAVFRSRGGSCGSKRQSATSRQKTSRSCGRTTRRSGRPSWRVAVNFCRLHERARRRPRSRHAARSWEPSRWPYVTTVTGERVDLREVPPPGQPRSVLAYLGGFTSGFFAVTNPRLRLGFGLRWPLEMFDKAWLWQEVHSSSGWPWFRRAYVLAVEPASTIPAQGMAVARAKGERGGIACARVLSPGPARGGAFRRRRRGRRHRAGGAVRFA